MMVRKYDWPLLAGRERFMKEKHRLIPVLIFAFILTVLCTAAVSRWYLLHQKGGTYNSILLGKLVSSDGRKLVLQGNITNLQGRNGQYAIIYSPGITAADKTKDSHITPPTAIPQLLVTYGPDKTEIPSFSGGYQLYTPNDEGTAEAVIACGAEPLSYLVGKVPDIPYVKLGTDISLEFREGTVPDSVTVQDLILRGDGSPKYNEQVTEEFTLACSGSTACFTLDINSAALLSSDMSSYEEAGILRGFRVNCRWDDNSTAEYGFVIRTDASSTEIRNQAD